MSGFAAGTRIRTPAGEVPIESLKIGDLVETLHGGVQRLKWIGRRAFEAAELVASAELRPICITAGALDDGIPAYDFFVSQELGICVDGGFIPAFRLVNGKSIFRDNAGEPITYIHPGFEEHEAVIAEACPVESLFESDPRDIFDNAAEYDMLYPVPVPGTPVLSLPRLSEGFLLQASLARIAERAGILPTEPVHGPLRGFVDRAGPVTVSGWAQCETQPEEPVCLDIIVGGVRILRALANGYRKDLAAAGLGSGNHAFSVELPEPASEPVEVRRTFDQVLLPLTDAALAEQAKTL